MEITSVGQFQPVKRGEEGGMGRKEETEGRKRMEEDQDPSAMLFSSNPELTLPLGKSCSVDGLPTLWRNNLKNHPTFRFFAGRPSATAAARVHSVQGEIGSFTAAAATDRRTDAR